MEVFGSLCYVSSWPDRCRAGERKWVYHTLWPRNSTVKKIADTYVSSFERPHSTSYLIDMINIPSNAMNVRGGLRVVNSVSMCWAAIQYYQLKMSSWKVMSTSVHWFNICVMPTEWILSCSLSAMSVSSWRAWRENRQLPSEAVTTKESHSNSRWRHGHYCSTGVLLLGLQATAQVSMKDMMER